MPHRAFLNYHFPQVEKFCAEKSVTHEEEVIAFLQNGTLVGLLPVPPPIVTRRYEASTRCTAWYHSYAWSIVFLRNLNPPLFFGTDVRLFRVEVLDA